MEIARIKVVIADDHIHDFLQIVLHLKEAGMQVEQALEFLGVVTGAIEAAQIPAIENTPGVAAVERQLDIGFSSDSGAA